MNSDTFAEWLSRQGHKIFIDRTGNYWAAQGVGAYQAFPYDQVITPNADELKTIFAKTHAIAIRYSTELFHPAGKISYHVIRKEKFVFEDFSKKVRHDVQHGLKYASYEPISFERMAEDGWNVRFNTLERQGRTASETKEQWQKLCLAARDLDGFESWGAIHDGDLIACVLCATIDHGCQILYHQSLTDHLKFGINNTLSYFVTNEILGRGNVDNVFYGVNSLDAPPSVDEFKFRMGFEARALRQRVVFNPLISPFLTDFSYAKLNFLRKKLPYNPTFSKAEGMLRFYLQGKRPLEEQDWPEVLLDQKDSILAQVNHH